MEFPGELKLLRCLVGFLGRRVPDGLTTLTRLWFIVLRNFPWHVVHQGAPVDLRGDLKHAFVKALLDDLSDGRLRESTGVDFVYLRLVSCFSLSECRLHSDLDEAVV